MIKLTITKWKTENQKTEQKNLISLKPHDASLQWWKVHDESLGVLFYAIGRNLLRLVLFRVLLVFKKLLYGQLQLERVTKPLQVILSLRDGVPQPVVLRDVQVGLLGVAVKGNQVLSVTHFLEVVLLKRVRNHWVIYLQKVQLFQKKEIMPTNPL